jgi:uncharacterized membrane-anchored protein
VTATLGVVWLSGGTITTVEGLGYRVGTSALLSTLVIVALVVLLILLWGLLRYLFTFPSPPI